MGSVIPKVLGAGISCERFFIRNSVNRRVPSLRRGRRGDVMASAPDSGSSCQCVVFLGKILYSHGASLHLCL